MNSIPDEIFVEIFKFLEGETIKKTKLVCSLFNNILKNQIFWKLYVKNHRRSKEKRVEEEIEKLERTEKDWFEIYKEVLFDKTFFKYYYSKSNRDSYSITHYKRTILLRKDGTGNILERVYGDHAWSDDGYDDQKEAKIKFTKQRIQMLKQLLSVESIKVIQPNQIDKNNNAMILGEYHQLRNSISVFQFVKSLTLDKKKCFLHFIHNGSKKNWGKIQIFNEV